MCFFFYVCALCPCVGCFDCCIFVCSDIVVCCVIVVVLRGSCLMRVACCELCLCMCVWFWFVCYSVFVSCGHMCVAVCLRVWFVCYWFPMSHCVLF